MTENTFDPIEHKYTINGREVPGVTSILCDTGLRELFFDREWYMDKGSKIHLCCHYHNIKTLNWETVDPLIYPYVEGYLKFKRECAVEVLESEYVLFNETLMYGTTIDTILKLNFMGIRTAGIVEIKSGQPQNSDQLQTAGQTLTLDPTDVRGIFEDPKILMANVAPAGYLRRFVLYLKENRTFKLVENTDMSDLVDFEAACRVYWRKRR